MVPALYQLSYESPKTPGGARTHDLRKRSVVLAARRTVPLRGQYRIRTCVSGYFKRAVSGIRTHDVNFIWPAWKAGAIDQLGDYRNLERILLFSFRITPLPSVWVLNLA
jgi:hypothetical protein